MEFINVRAAMIILVGLVVFFLRGNSFSAPSIVSQLPTLGGGSALTAASDSKFDPKNATYEIDGRVVTLMSGVSEIAAAPGSASKITTRYFGNEARGDLNGDGTEDVAFLITQSDGGTGLFYYVVVTLKMLDGYKMTNVFLLGDRIAPQTTEIDTGARELLVNYADRKPGEPMTAQPSVGVTLRLKVTPGGMLTKLAL